MFLAAAIGRSVSCYHLWRMHDPVPLPVVAETNQLVSTLRLFAHAMHDRTFRNYTIFIACMQGMVAISAPFFAVYMLNELHFTYFQYALNLMASIAVQFLMLRFWGKISDSQGNRLVMLVCGFMIPILPILWLFSSSFYYLLLVQMISGLFWSGFTLTTANYLYDIRPHHTNFATYAAVQALFTGQYCSDPGRLAAIPARFCIIYCVYGKRCDAGSGTGLVSAQGRRTDCKVAS